MHNGFHVLQTKSDSIVNVNEEGPLISSIDQVAHFKKHESLAYGVDWWRDIETLNSSSPVVGSCSFYDHVFHVWRISLVS
jgi:diphthamide biosynthesis protein 7